MAQQLILTRFKEDSYQTLGHIELYNNRRGIFSCKALELPWRNNERRISRIPANHYPAIRHISPNFGKSIWILNVPNRSEILIHKGNFAASMNPRTGRPDTLGCPLVGERHVDIDGDGHKDVTNSANTMNKLYDLCEDKLYINVIDLFS